MIGMAPQTIPRTVVLLSGGWGGVVVVVVPTEKVSSSTGLYFRRGGTLNSGEF